MSELIIIGYDDHAVAERAYERVQQLQHDFILELSGLAVLRVDLDGKKHVDTPSRIVGASAASGALWGMLFGLLFLSPGLGLVLGGAWGWCWAAPGAPWWAGWARRASTARSRSASRGCSSPATPRW